MSEDSDSFSTESKTHEAGKQVADPAHRRLSKDHLGGGVLLIIVVEIIEGSRGHWGDLESEILLSLIILGASIWMYAELRYKLWSRLISIAGAVTLAIIGVAVALWTHASLERSKSALSITYSWMQSTGPTVSLWMAGQGTVTPIYYAFLTTLTNESTKPLMVYSFDVKEQTKDGKWLVVTPSTGTIYSIFFAGEDRKAVYEQDFVTLESTLANKNIFPGESVRGWVFLTKEFSGSLEFTAMDASGNITKEPFVPVFAHNPDGTHPGFPMQPLLAPFAGKGKQDISSFPLSKSQAP